MTVLLGDAWWAQLGDFAGHIIGQRVVAFDRGHDTVFQWATACLFGRALKMGMRIDALSI